MNSAKAIVWLLTALVIALAGLALFWLRYLRIPENVAYVTEEEGAVSVIDLNAMRVVHRVEPPDFAPRGLAVTFDGKYLITSNKNSSDLAVFDTRNMRLRRRVHLGQGPEFVKIGPNGDRVFATFEPGSSGRPPSANAAENDDDNEPPAQIASFYVNGWTPGPRSEEHTSELQS